MGMGQIFIFQTGSTIDKTNHIPDTGAAILLSNMQISLRDEMDLNYTSGMTVYHAES